MMKYIFVAFVALIALSSCTGEEREVIDDSQNETSGDNFTITGAIDGASNTVFHLEAQSPNGMINVAQAISDDSGNFKMVGNIPGFGMYQLRMGENAEEAILLTLVPGDDLKINATKENYSIQPTAEGTNWSEALNQYCQKVSDYRRRQEEIDRNRDNYSDEELEELFLGMKNEMDEFAIGWMTKDPSNPYNLVFSTYAVPSRDFMGWDPDNLEVLNGVVEAYNKEFPNSPIAKTLAGQTEQIEMAYNQFLMNSGGSRPAPEIALKNPDGKEIRLSSLQGKYVLIDFWASWCAPCRRENPNVVKMYNKYKDQGFTVYSVSLDEDKESWKEAIEKDGLIWPNHVSDLLQWKSPMPQLYGFSGIPHTVLVDKEGFIIGTGLRGASLEQKLKEIFEN